MRAGNGSTDEKRRKKRRRLGSSDTEPPRLPRERHGSFLLSFFPSRPLNYFLSFAAPHVPQTMGWLGKEKINKRGQETGRKGKDGKESGGKIDEQKKWRKAGTGGTDERASERCERRRGGGKNRDTFTFCLHCCCIHLSMPNETPPQNCVVLGCEAEEDAAGHESLSVS